MDDLDQDLRTVAGVPEARLAMDVTGWSTDVSRPTVAVTMTDAEATTASEAHMDAVAEAQARLTTITRARSGLSTIRLFHLDTSRCTVEPCSWVE
jgi:hypothetical protein